MKPEDHHAILQAAATIVRNRPAELSDAVDTAIEMLGMIKERQNRIDVNSPEYRKVRKQMREGFINPEAFGTRGAQ